jgi:DNA-3-methyladenine glycosylase II
MSMKRFRVAEDSMRPAFEPGDELVTTTSKRPSEGDPVVFPHPRRDDFWLVKRVGTPPETLDDGQLWVLSDNAEVTTTDSLTLGPIPSDSALAVVERFDETTFVEAVGLLASEDDTIATAIDRFGVPRFWVRPPGLPCLVLLILEQQVSLESGAAMYRRLDEITDGVTADDLVEVGTDKMRSIGITRQKAGYLHSLATLVTTGGFDIDALSSLPPDQARSALISLKGIGPWTADAYLLSALRHPDMYPVGDRALQVGVGEVLGMSNIPDEEELEILAEPWRPVRAAAARIVWHAYLSKRGRTEPPDPTLDHTPAEDA